MSQDTKIERLENKVTELQRAVTSQNNQLT